MKVIHLNTYDGNGGAGKASLRLNTALKSIGISSKVFVLMKFGNDNAVGSFSDNFFSKLIITVKILAERFLPKLYEKGLKIPFSLQFFGINVSQHEALKDADVIHLHWINHGFLTPKNLAQLVTLNKPIVWTFHDSNAFTGGCHVRYTCDRFEQACGYCPILKTPGVNDVSAKTWQRKQQAYKTLKFEAVCPSQWMQNSVKSSGLLQNIITHQIPNTLNLQTFKPQEKTFCRKELNLPADAFIVLSGFMPSKKDMHKGAPYLVEALSHLVKIIGESQKICLVVFGNSNKQEDLNLPIPVIFLGKIASEEKIVKCYASADVFVAPSLEDNLPNTVMESMACGTPVVGFKTGGIPDMVKHEENGYLANYRDAQDLAVGINWVYNHPERKILGEKARNYVVENYAEEIIASKYQEVYDKVLANHRL